MTTRPAYRPALVAVLAAAALLVPAVTVHATGEDDESLQQIIDPNQAQGTGKVVLEDGHMDYGPTLNTGDWIIQVHDDTAQPSYWRMLSDVVAKVSDKSKLTVPDDGAYSFLGLPPGTEAWVIPQVRTPGVIWTGWNTQEPGVLESLNMGVTQRVLGVSGPGDVTVYLQSGNFGQPEVLWSSLEPFPQETWIEVNTHTHANWIFSEPGVYLVQIQFEGQLVDGTTASATDTLRFAVGDETDPQTAFLQAPAEESSNSPSPVPSPEDPENGASPDDLSPASSEQTVTMPMTTLLAIVASVVGVALVGSIIVVVITGRRARTKARAARAARNEHDQT